MVTPIVHFKVNFHNIFINDPRKENILNIVTVKMNIFFCICLLKVDKRLA